MTKKEMSTVVDRATKVIHDIVDIVSIGLNVVEEVRSMSNKETKGKLLAESNNRAKAIRDSRSKPSCEEE